MLQPFFAAAQDDPICGWTPENSTNGETENNPASACFDEAAVFNDCTPVYLRFNFHFFVNDNCSGNVQITKLGTIAATDQASAYRIAEDLINQANGTLSNNSNQWTVQGSVPICNPIRMVLSGVYFHCKSNAVGGYDTHLLQNAYGINKSSEINVFVADFPPDVFGNATGIGYRNGAFASIDWTERGNFIHEIGHVLNLPHSFDPDGCDDSPQITYDWDRNGSGVIGDFPLEVGQQCWSSIVDEHRIAGQSGYVDGNNNGTHDCSESGNHTKSPCCGWLKVDNNVMSYNAAKSALTECQIKTMLTEINQNKCNYVAGVGGDCPPPSAFIGQTAIDGSNTSFCSECLSLSACFNETAYMLEIHESGSAQPVISTGWKNGKAQNFCFSTVARSPVAGNYLKPNTQYRAMLTVRNACGETDTAEFDFTTPGTNCTTVDGPGRGDLKTSPNPAHGQITVQFGANADEKYQLWASNNMTGSSTVLLQDHSATEGENELTLHIYDLAPGSYTLTLIGDSHLYQSHLAKF